MRKQKEKKKNRKYNRTADRRAKMRDKRKSTGKTEYRNALTGTFLATQRGFGFVRIEGEENDIFIPADDTENAFHNDEVKVVISKEADGGRRREGRVVEVTARNTTQVVGSFEKSHGFGFIISDDLKFGRDVYIPEKCYNGAKNGDKVIAEITDYGSRKKSPTGKITEILGNIRTPGVDIEAIVKSFGLPEEFPEKVIRQAERVPDHISEADRDGRRDLRDLLMVTIDGEDAKDLDDAVSLYKEDGIWHLGVHIADVSNYVQGNSALDREALKRGTSVYLPDRVIPMLPKRLSNGICSLNAGEDRLALSCLMDFDQGGEMISHEIVESVICVDRRMSYNEVCRIFDGTEDTSEYENLVAMFFDMKKLSDIIRADRHTRGSIDFDFPEAKVILNKAGKAVDIVPHEANDATRIIEDFMLMANETVAMEYCTEELPFVYRTHENPDSEKIENLLTIIRNQGIKVEKSHEDISPKEIQSILEKVSGLPNEAQISRMMLRTMKQAKYTTECSGHFGLAAKYYCHFTSPIRRYPDLQIHRIIKDRLRHRIERVGRTEHYKEILDHVCEQSSMCERRAQETEREALKLKKAEYMSWHLGEEFEGIISGVTNWGIYVELKNTVEGLVPIGSMRDDYYILDDENSQLIGEAFHKIYKLGDHVRIRVYDADLHEKKVEFELVEGGDSDAEEQGHEADRKQ